MEILHFPHVMKDRKDIQSLTLEKEVMSSLTLKLTINIGKHRKERKMEVCLQKSQILKCSTSYILKKLKYVHFLLAPENGIVSIIHT